MQNLFTVDLVHLRTLRELRERETVTATAAALHLTPSAVSQQVAALSRSVGAPLLARHGRRVRLTPQAVILLEHADRMHAELEAARADLAAFETGQAGVVSVGAFATAIAGLVVPALRVLALERPGISLEVDEAEPPECFSRLDAGALDVAVTVDYAFGPSRDDPRYHRTELYRDPLRAVVPATHARAADKTVSIADLAGERWVVGATGHPCFDITMAAYTAASVTPRIVHRANDWEAVLALVAGGAGVALVPSLALGPRRVDIGILTVRPGEPARNIYAAVRSGSQHAPHIAAVLDVLRAVAASRLPQADNIRRRRKGIGRGPEDPAPKETLLLHHAGSRMTRMTGMTSEANGIVRTWSATASADGAREYHRYFAGTLLPQLRDRPGFVGAYLLSRPIDAGVDTSAGATANGAVELTTHTIWASLDAIRAFAGDDITAAVVEPEARSVLLYFDRTVVHRGVLIAPDSVAVHQAP